MQRLDLTLATPAENLALDEALLDWAEEANSDWEFLRIWESPQPMVVVGRSSRVHQEVDEAACRETNAPILRRSSGGAAIVAGPGCLMYAVVLGFRLRPELKDIGRAHAYVLGRLAATIGPLVARVGSVAHVGTSDLALVNQSSEQRKFSGNSMRVKRTHMLYHGTLMFDCDMSLVARLLRMPPRQPEYRAARSHNDFLVNLPLARRDVIAAVQQAWPTAGRLMDWPGERVASLVAERFSQSSWTYEFA
ncbi:MAG TPA: lipoate--protein ligase family protein [Lacipirellulaceae bacterium]|nr:lipoate--protein ligase family protein [Lacipirellulaceae bacterium]